MNSRIFGTAMVGLVGAVIGSFSMMIYASTHFSPASPDPTTSRRR